MSSGDRSWWVDASPGSRSGPTRLALSLRDSDGVVKKMTGDFPTLWKEKHGDILGPEVYDQNQTYKVIYVDYQNKSIWLMKYHEN